MKILHTSDWHLGDKSNGVNRIDEQREIVNEIIAIANDNDVDVVLICGDVYNTNNPSSEAEELFFDAIERLSNHGNRVVFAISGNHDDPERLQAARGLANTHNIVLTGDIDLTGKKYKNNGKVEIVETGYGYLKIKKDKELLTLAFLPYSNNVRMNDGGEDVSYAEKVKRWITPGVSKFSDNSFNVLAMHLFVAGSKIRGVEMQVGGLMSVPHNICPESDYIALGHMHTNQKVGENAYYSGSTIRRHVISCNPSVNILTTENNKLKDVKVVELTSPVCFERVVVSSLDEVPDALSKFSDRDIVELVIKTSEAVSSIALKELKKKYKCIRNVAFELKALETKQENIKLKELTSEELFTRFYMKQTGFSPRKELVDFFMECGGDSNETN